MFEIPTLKELAERARQAFRVNLPGSDAYLWPNNINPTAKVFAGLTHEVFGFADYIQRQKFALTADLENLILHGEEVGLTLRPAAPWRGFATVNAAAAISFDVGAVLQRSDGVDYIATAGGSIAVPGVFDIEVVASVDGSAAAPIAGTPLDIISGATGDVIGATAQISDAAPLAAGVDVEDVETFRARILFRKRNPPHGGTAADYVAWCGEVPGVSFYQDRPTVFVERLWSGAGTVRLFPLMFDLYDDGIPRAADVQRVADHIDMVRPAGAKVAVAAATAVPVDVVIAGLSPGTSAVREAIKSELRGTFRRLARVAGIDQADSRLPYLAAPFSFSRSWIWQAVANASGEERHIIQSPTADITLTPGQFPTLGDVSFV
ncbi:baseplate J/gp47 family protein [Rhodopseudomonas sp. B29]|uniref:baseplate J/gp47 family protein n=1 Tax=Rhodopseudomonas sp. B29 TaxID=95607 RepID=UPI00034A05EE|nr:baseplate J/gp47 family protein [Rhodopseudomonas sp. B29]